MPPNTNTLARNLDQEIAVQRHTFKFVPHRCSVETKVGTTPCEVGGNILDGVLGPVPLGLPVPHGLGHKGLGICVAYGLLPGDIALPVDVADKVSQDGMRTTGIEKQELRQLWRCE